MKYVLDASVAIKWVLAEVDSDKALRLRDDFVLGIHELLAPEIFPGEVGHALTKAERQKRIKVGEAAALWSGIMTTPPKLVPTLPLTSGAIDISSVTRVGVFDCMYVVLADSEKCNLITADDKLLKNLQPHFPCVVALASLP